MSDRFIQKRIELNRATSTGRIKVAKLIELIEQHPYSAVIKETFNVKSILNEYIVVGNIDTIFGEITRLKSEYIFRNIKANSTEVFFSKGIAPVEGIKSDNPLIFNFLEYIDGFGEIQNSTLSAYAIYESKNTFFEEFSMSKFANMLYDNGLHALADINLNYFKNIANSKPEFNKYKSYRLVENNSEVFVRGITSEKYSEYGVDFTFVVSMLMLYKNIKRNTGNNYSITFAAVSESKFDFIISSNELKQAGDFGVISSAIGVSTNDLGKGALNFVNIIKLDVKGKGVYLYPNNKEVAKKNINISHIQGHSGVLKTLSEADDFYSYIDIFIKDLEAVKVIKTPNDLRLRILLKIEHPNSSFKSILKELQDIFKTQINNEVKDFAKLLEMCYKAEELEIEYDLKDKLRVTISEIILNKK